MMEKLFCSNNSEFAVIEENYRRITEKINLTLQKAKRNDSVRLMAVTKTVLPEKINFAISLGTGLLGENRVQEFIGKYQLYDKNAEIHFIGGLQNNKVKYIIDKVNMIHSVDEKKLADEINKRAASIDKTLDILIQVNIAGETTKGGISKDELPEFMDYCSKMKNIRVRGLMAIPPVDNCGSNTRYFEQMQRLFEDRRNGTFDTLSMGMSNDYENAVYFGSTIVRIGSSLFGYRKYGGN